MHRTEAVDPLLQPYLHLLDLVAECERLRWRHLYTQAICQSKNKVADDAWKVGRDRLRAYDGARAAAPLWRVDVSDLVVGLDLVGGQGLGGGGGAERNVTERVVDGAVLPENQDNDCERHASDGTV